MTEPEPDIEALERRFWAAVESGTWDDIKSALIHLRVARLGKANAAESLDLHPDTVGVWLRRFRLGSIGRAKPEKS